MSELGGHYKIVNLPRDAEAWADALPVLRELRPSVTHASVHRLLELDDPQGVQFFAVFYGQVCVGVSGFRIMQNTSNGTKLYVDDLVTAAGHRSLGIGALMMTELRKRANFFHCMVLDLDSGVQRHDAHRFYLGQRMDITAHHFGVPL